MDLNNLITASNYTIPENGIAIPVLNKITEVTGYHWKMYFPNVDIMSNFYPAIHNFFFHNWIGSVVGILMLIIIGEFLFYRALQDSKAQYTESNNSFVLKHKVLSYFLSFFILAGILVFIPMLVLMVSIILLNIILFSVIFAVLGLQFFILGLILCLGIKIIVSINKAMFGHLIKKETAEEYEARQATYKFRDGTLVKVKPNIVEDVTIIDDHKATHRLEKMSKEGKVYTIKNHNSKGKVNLRDAEDNDPGANRFECWVEEASQEDKDKFIKENEAYKIKEVEENKKIFNKFLAWCFKQ